MRKLSGIVLGTGSYDSVKSGNTLSVTGDGGNHWGYFGPSYKKLAPRLKTYLSYAEQYQELLRLKEDIQKYLVYRKQIEEEYIQSYYETRLKELDVDYLLRFWEDKYGSNIVLLCHEPIDEFCHRRLIADYIELKTGLYIPEVSIDENGKVKKLIPICYKERLKEYMD